MAKSRFEYVKKFEVNNICLPNTWIVVRIDGRSFHRFSDEHKFKKPNDIRCLSLMSRCSKEVMNQFHDIVISYGQSDEYSFVFKRNSNQFGRRENKLMSNIVSLFSTSFVYYWKDYFLDTKLLYPPMFDSRTVVYPTIENIKDYLSWRQADCHINNLYNTTFWTLVQKGNLTNIEAEGKLKGSLSADKNELLFTDYGINYNEEPLVFKKGTIQIREKFQEQVEVPAIVNIVAKDQKHTGIRERTKVVELHCDMISEEFWKTHNILI